MNQEKIGKFITELRKEKNMTQEQLAEKLGVSNKSVSRWENGKTMPDYSVLEDICRELGININELMSGEKIEKENYMPKAEENFIALKSKVDRVRKLLDMCRNIILVVMIILFIFYIFFKFVYKGIFDVTNITNITRQLFYISTICSIGFSMLNYEIKK